MLNLKSSQYLKTITSYLHDLYNSYDVEKKDKVDYFCSVGYNLLINIVNSYNTRSSYMKINSFSVNKINLLHLGYTITTMMEMSDNGVLSRNNLDEYDNYLHNYFANLTTDKRFYNIDSIKHNTTLSCSDSLMNLYCNTTSIAGLSLLFPNENVHEIGDYIVKNLFSRNTLKLDLLIFNF